MVGNGGGHALYEVVELVEAGVDDGVAERFEAVDVEGDVVVDEEDGARAVALRVADVVEDSVEGVGEEVAAAHFDDGAEAAVKCAAARCFDDVDLAAEKGVAGEDAGAPFGQADIVVFEAVRGALRVVNPLVALFVRESGDEVQASVALK